MNKEIKRIGRSGLILFFDGFDDPDQRSKDWRLQPNRNDRINRLEEEEFVTRDCIGSTIDCLTETMMV